MRPVSLARIRGQLRNLANTISSTSALYRFLSLLLRFVSVFVSGLSVATPGDLFSLSGSGDGRLVYVRSDDALWTYDAESTAPIDGVYVVAAAGPGRWIMYPYRSLFRTVWYIDPVNGSDATGSGDFSSPIRSLPELRRRTGPHRGDLPAPGEIRVNVMGDLAGSHLVGMSPANLTQTLRLVGRQTLTGSGSLVAVTVFNPATSQWLEVNAPALVGAPVGRLIVFTSGPNIGLTAAVVADLGGNNFRITLPGVLNPLVGDTFDIVSLTRITGDLRFSGGGPTIWQGFEIDCQGGYVYSQFGPVTYQQCVYHFARGGSVSPTGTPLNVHLRGSEVSMDRTLVDTGTTTAATTALVQIEGTLNLSLAGVVGAGRITSANGGNVAIGAPSVFVAEVGAPVVATMIRAVDNGGWFVPVPAATYNSQDGVRCGVAADLDIRSFFFGTATLRGFSIEGEVWFNNATRPNIVAPVAVRLSGKDIASYLALPAVHGVNTPGAFVDAAGVVAPSTNHNVVSVTHVGPGVYDILLAQTVGLNASVTGRAQAAGFSATARRSGPSTVTVETFTLAGAPGDAPFTFMVDDNATLAKMTPRIGL